MGEGRKERKRQGNQNRIKGKKSSAGKITVTQLLDSEI